MKQTKGKDKLKLKKQTISNLSQFDQSKVKAGSEEEQWTTSIGHCTGFLCCRPSETCTWVTTLPTTITVTVTL